MKDPTRYSTIRKEPAYKPADGFSMNSFYDLLIKPSTIVLLLVGYFTAINRDLQSYIDGAIQGDKQSFAHLSLLILSLVAGFRIIQSLYLAKRDYSHIESGLSDVVIFVAVVAFASGAAVKLLRSNMVIVLSIYSACAIVATVNFFRLFRSRIPDNSDNYDYPIERKIQAVNTIVFACLTVLLILAAVAAHEAAFQPFYWMMGAGCALIIFNTIHSQQLTMGPKFLLHNDEDSINNSLKIFREIFGHLVTIKSDEEITAAIFKHSDTGFQSIKTRRAQRSDVERIADSLLQAFPYIFRYILGINDKTTLKRTLQGMITAAGGFGALGYMNFYVILNKKGEEVGLFKMDTAHNNWPYQGVAAIKIPLIIIRNIRAREIVRIWERAKLALSTQSSPRKREIRLTYVIIFSKHRGQGYAQSFLRLLQNACRNYTNDIVGDCITLVVREHNTAARQLFEKSGFSYLEKDLSSNADPFVDAKTIGKALLMEYRLS